MQHRPQGTALLAAIDGLRSRNPLIAIVQSSRSVTCLCEVSNELREVLHHPAPHFRPLRQLKCRALVERRDHPRVYIAKSMASNVVNELAPVQTQTFPGNQFPNTIEINQAP